MTGKMTTDEVIADLEVAATQSEYAAEACNIMSAAFRPRFEKAEGQLKIDLYPYVLHQEQEARRLKREAELFRRAIEIIKELRG